MKLWGIRKNFLYIVFSNFLSLMVAALLIGWFAQALYGGRYLQRVYVVTDKTSYDVVAIGDSITEGVGASQARGYITLLSERTGVPIYNLAVRRSRTDDLFVQAEQSMKYRPKLVIMTGGGNDVIWEYQLDTTFENLEKIFDFYQEQGVRVLYLGERTGVWTDPHQDDFTKFTAQFSNAIFVPNILDGILLHPEYLFDILHPNDAGYSLIADRVEPVMRAELQKLNIPIPIRDYSIQ